jgi:hypothetical protein
MSRTQMKSSLVSTPTAIERRADGICEFQDVAADTALGAFVCTAGDEFSIHLYLHEREVADVPQQRRPFRAEVVDRAPRGRLVPRTRSSRHIAAGTVANFGFKSATGIIVFLVSFSIPKFAEKSQQILANFGIETRGTRFREAFGALHDP